MVETRITFEPVLIDTGSADEEGKLVFIDNRLAAILVKLSELHGEDEGVWYVETVFKSTVPARPSFNTLHDAATWIAHQFGCTIDPDVEHPTLTHRRVPSISLSWNAAQPECPQRARGCHGG